MSLWTNFAIMYTFFTLPFLCLPLATKIEKELLHISIIISSFAIGRICGKTTQKKLRCVCILSFRTFLSTKV